MSTNTSFPMHPQSTPRFRPIGFGETVALFGGAALLLFVATHVIIPRLADQLSLEPIVLWFVVGGFGVFVPLALAGWLLLVQEGSTGSGDVWQSRLRFRRMNAGDWLWTLAGCLAIGAIMMLSLMALKFLTGQVDLQPSFMHFTPLTPGRYWILAAWVPFFLVNILGEELLWRGVILPRQEEAFGRWAWLANGAGWLLFHVAFGAVLLAVLWPTTLIIPYVVQRRQNSWIGVVIHAALNGGGFLAIAFGLLA